MQLLWIVLATQLVFDAFDRGLGSRVIAASPSTFVSVAFIPNQKCITRQHCLLHAKRKARAKKRNNKTYLDEDDVRSVATMNKPAELAGAVEDQRFEQFFYDESTAKQLYQLVKLYERPLLMCNPTLAVLADRDNQEYKLLDRDTRFGFLEGYEEFSLTEPHLIKDYEFDSVFIDPPFTSITPEQVAKCLRSIAADGCPLWVAYNSRREEQLLSALNELDCPNLVPKWKLSYKEGVSESTQDAIWLYGPADLIAS